MQMEMDLANNFINYLKLHGYPDESIAVEYKIGDKYRADIVILDLKKNIPIQIFEIKSRKSIETINRGTDQLKQYLKLLNNNEIPAYLVFPNSREPFFEVVRINEVQNQTDEEIKNQNDLSLNYKAQRLSRLAEEAKVLKTEKKRTIDTFAITCWITAGIMLIIGILSKFNIIVLNATDLTILGVIIALVLIPFASKLKILGVEFERLTEEDKGKNA